MIVSWLNRAGTVSLRGLVAFGKFWYGFVIGDDWTVAAAVAGAPAGTRLLHPAGVAPLGRAHRRPGAAARGPPGGAGRWPRWPRRGPAFAASGSDRGSACPGRPGHAEASTTRTGTAAP